MAASIVDTPRQRASPAGWRSTFRALRHRDFRLYFFGQIVSLTGTWMQTLALSWLVYRLTRSPLLMGATVFTNHLPVLLLAPLGGLAADRSKRLRIVLAAQTALLLQALALAALTLSGQITIPRVLVLAAIWGSIHAFDIPARQALYVHMVGKEDLQNAIALNSVVFNTARLLGPPVAGVLVAAIGEGYCFLINAVSYLAVISSFLLMRVREPDRFVPDSPWAHLRDGFNFAWHARAVRALLGAAASINLVIAPVVVLAPVFADVFFHRGSHGLGLLTGSLGIGALVGTLGLARRTQTTGMERLINRSTLTMAVALAVFAASPSFHLSMAAMALAGFSLFQQNASCNTMIQSIIPDDYRGRVMALFSMMVIGMNPVGSLLAGGVAERLGTRWTVALGAMVALAAAAAFRRAMPEIRRAMPE